MTAEHQPINLKRVAANCERIVNRETPLSNYDLFLLARGIITHCLKRTIQPQDQLIAFDLSDNLTLRYKRQGIGRFVDIEQRIKNTPDETVKETLWLRQEGGKFITYVGSTTFPRTDDHPTIHPFHRVTLTAEQMHHTAKMLWQAYQSFEKLP